MRSRNGASRPQDDSQPFDHDDDRLTIADATVVPLPASTIVWAGGFRLSYGKYEGLTLAEIAALGPEGTKRVHYYARCGRDPVLRAAANALLTLCCPACRVIDCICEVLFLRACERARAA